MDGSAMSRQLRSSADRVLGNLAGTEQQRGLPGSDPRERVPPGETWVVVVMVMVLLLLLFLNKPENALKKCQFAEEHFAFDAPKIDISSTKRDICSQNCRFEATKNHEKRDSCSCGPNCAWEIR